jgi:hypothetical protein
MSIRSTLEGSSRQTSAPPVVAPKEKIPLSTHLIAGGIAGLAEALAWYVPIHSFQRCCFYIERNLEEGLQVVIHSIPLRLECSYPVHAK